MFRAGLSWELRQSMECDACSTERRRRCRVMLPGNGNDGAHRRAPFVDAPYIHPFNAPRYHAQVLRTMNYAKLSGKRVMWVVAHDRPLTCEDENMATESLEKQRERWLQLHDKVTNGIMGLLPLVHDMPMRFTSTENAAYGVFKNSRGKL